MVQLRNGECVEVRSLGRSGKVAAVMERANVRELYFDGRLLEQYESVAMSITRGAVLRIESRKGGVCCAVQVAPPLSFGTFVSLRCCSSRCVEGARSVRQSVRL